MEENKEAESIPESPRDLGITDEYFHKLHGLFLMAKENDFMAFFRKLQEQKITINF